MNTVERIRELREIISAVPRVRLAPLPTPLQEVPRFAAALGGPRIFIKRDDLTGLAFGGNKTRMFEFLLARAVREGADSVVAGAGVQSNYCRQITAACNALGLETHLVLRRVRGARDDDVQGNLLLDLIAGASVRIIRGDESAQREAIYGLAKELKRKGRRPFVARMANDEDLTPDVIGYVLAFCEIVEQCEGFGVEPARIYLATYDTTQAGLELGRAYLASGVRIVGVAPGIWKSEPRDLVSRCANQAAEALGVPHRITPDDVFNTKDFVGAGYGIPSAESTEMLKLLARTEGIFLDPVYTCKAMAGLHDHVKRGQLRDAEAVVFLHTGGLPALFAYVEELGEEELRAHLSIE